MDIRKLLINQKAVIKAFVYYFYDFLRFYRSSIAFRKPFTKEQWIAILTIDYHRIEKGLALPSPKPGFGKIVAHRLITNTDKYIKLYGKDPLTEVVASSLLEYSEFLNSTDEENTNVIEFIENYGRLQSPRTGGTKTISKIEIDNQRNKNISGFFASRYSIRQFSDLPVTEELLLGAVEMARKTPSVCNRQCGRANLTTDPLVVARALSYQNGNSGYGDRAKALFVISAEMSAFEKVDERNQGWIDGGLYAMSLVYALHAMGLGTCMLNWSVGSKRDREFRQAFDISDSENIIMMIAVGHIPAHLKVAQSPRRPVEDYVRKLSLRIVS